MKRLIPASLCVALLAASGGPSAASAQARARVEEPGRVEVITSGTFSAALDILGPLFQEATGTQVSISYGSTTGGGPESIPVRLDRGERFDLLIMGRATLDELAEAGVVRPDSRVNLAVSQIGVAVRSGAPRPDISTPEAFVAAMLAARSIGYAASISGTYLSTELFPRLGIWDEIEPKSVRVVTERVGAAILRGEVEVGFQQVSEILPIEGVDLVGVIPAELQPDFWFAAGITRNAKNSDGARRLLEFLNSPAATPVIESTGLHPNPRPESP